MSVLTTVTIIVFATALFARSVDPVIPQIAEAMLVDPTTVALLSTAFALPFALIQPVLGPLADMVGKTRLMMVSLTILVLAAFGCALAPSFEWLMAARIVMGLSAGGIFPVSLALAGDLVPVAQRQIVIGRFLSSAMIGNLLGAVLAGVIGDVLGWRGVFVASGLIGAAVLTTAFLAFRGRRIDQPAAFNLTTAIRNYGVIFANPLAKFCFGAVFFEGLFAHGVFPYVAVLLVEQGEVRASIAGVVIAGFGVGAALYGVSVARLLQWFGERGTMQVGSAMVIVALLLIAARLPWPVQIAIFCMMGFGFFMLHGVLQIYATELAPQARGSAVSLHAAFYFLGQAMGPVYFGFGFERAGATATLLSAATGYTIVAIVCSLTLRRPAKSS